MVDHAPEVVSGKHAQAKSHTEGHPLDDVHYREYKIILRPEHFVTPQSFQDFWKQVHSAAKGNDVGVDRDAHADVHHIREVLFYDTPGFDLYNNSFILRTRRFFENGWPQQDQELTFKFRHKDVDAAAAVDVRPTLPSRYRIKFKEEVLPLRDGIGGMRSLFSHNCVLTSSGMSLERALGDVAKVFPALQTLESHSKAKIALVNQTAVEEVCADLGEVHFGHSLSAKATLAVWRNRGTQIPLCGEFAFQCKFERYSDLHDKPRKRSEEFFKRLQVAAREWVMVGITKTAIVYGLGKTPPTNHE